MTGRFSILIPCRNQGRFLANAVDSALGQTLPPVQIIVVDDGSEDDSARVASHYGGRVELVRQDPLGLPQARNAGLRRARGDFVLFLDADDYLDSDALEAHARASASCPDAAVFCGGWCMVDESGALLSRHDPPTLADDAYGCLLRGNPMPCHAVAVRRSAVEQVGGFDTGLRAFEDWDLWLRLAGVGFRFQSSPGAVAYYRRYPGTLSRDLGRMLASARKILRKHRPAAGRRLQHGLARFRAMRAIRYGLWCNELLPRGRRLGKLAMLSGLLRHPSLLEGMAIDGLTRLLPGLRWRLGIGSPRDSGSG